MVTVLKEKGIFAGVNLFSKQDTMDITDMFKIPLFKNFTLKMREEFLDKLEYTVEEHPKGKTIIHQGTTCNALHVLLKGKLNVDVLDVSGNIVRVGMEGGDAEKQNSDTKYLQTLGTNLIYTPSHWMVGGMFYYQFGKTKSGRDVSAFLWAVNAAYQIDPQWKIGVGSDYLSGSDGADGKYKAFDPLYGTHHKFYGAMDYFYASSFVNGLNPGLWDNQVNVAYKPSSKVNLSLAYHYFSITGDVYEGNDKLSKGLGSELDFQVDWVIMKDVKLSAGYSTMLGTNTMKVVKGGNPSHWQDWGWLSININPTIFTTKW